MCSGRSILPILLCCRLWDYKNQWLNGKKVDKYPPVEAAYFKIVKFCDLYIIFPFLLCIPLFWYSRKQIQHCNRPSCFLTESLLIVPKLHNAWRGMFWEGGLTNKYKTMLWMGIQLKCHLNADSEHCILLNRPLVNRESRQGDKKKE